MLSDKRNSQREKNKNLKLKDKEKVNHLSFSDSTTIEKEISKKTRNTILYHLGIPYYIGKKINKISIELGKKSVELGKKGYQEAFTIGDLLAKNVKTINIKVIEKEK